MRKPSAALLLLVLWALFIVYGTTIPFDFRFDRATAAQGWHDAQWHPLRNPEGGRLSRTDVFSNFVLFLPLGLVAFAAYRRRDRGPLGPFLFAAATGIFLSAAVETLQLWSPLRTTSTNDLFTNTLGAMAGAAVGAWWFSRGIGVLLPPLERAAREHPKAALAVGVVALWWGSGLLPLDLSLDVDDLKRAVKACRLVPFAPTDFIGRPVPPRPAAWVADLLRFSVLGGFFAWALRRTTDPTPVRGLRLLVVLWRSTLLTAFVALGVELEQMLVVSRGTDLTVVVLAGGGGLLGALVFVRSSRPSRALLAAMLAWIGVLVLDRWAPFAFARPTAIGTQWRHWLPFLPYFQRLGPAAVTDLIREVGMGVPLGLFWALWRPSPTTPSGPRTDSGRTPDAGAATGVGPAAAGLAGFLLGIVLESGQLFVEGRTADLTDALSLGAGVALGVVLARKGQNRAFGFKT